MDLSPFINRVYQHVLSRPGEADGRNFWCGKGLDEGYTAYQLAEKFVFSDEFVSRGYSNEDYVAVLYRAFMGREPEPSGFRYWVDELDANSRDRRAVFEDFVRSEEFGNISANFGVRLM